MQTEIEEMLPPKLTKNHIIFKKFAGLVFFSYDFGRFCRNLLHLLYVLELVWQKYTNGHGFTFLYKNVNHGLKLYTLGVQTKTIYARVEKVYMS